MDESECCFDLADNIDNRLKFLFRLTQLYIQNNFLYSAFITGKNVLQAF